MPSEDTNAALLQAGGSLVGTFANAAYNSYQADKQRQWEEQQATIAYQRSLDMWNRTNEYNDPSAQLARMRNAGLNTLYYALDGQSAQAFQAQMANNYQRSDVSGLLNPFTSAAQAYNEAKLNQARVDNLQADTAYKSNMSLSEIERRANLVQMRNEIEQRANYLKSSAKLNDKQAAKIEQFMEYAADIYQSQIDRDVSVAGLNDTQRRRITALLSGEKELQRLSIQDFSHKWQKWQAEINHLVSQDKLLAKQATYYLLSLLSNGVYGSGVSAINGLIMSYIMTDPDLTQQEKDDLSKIVAPEGDDTKRKYKPSQAAADLMAPISDMADPMGNYFGPTF